jgi:ferredoxin-NADP reductase
VFVAGGIGVNPLMAMLSHLSEMPGEDRGFDVKMLYSVRDPGPGRNGKGILFLGRLMGIFEAWGNCDGLQLYLTPGKKGEEAGEAVLGGEEGEILYRRRRIRRADLESCLGEVRDRAGTVVYVCGVPEMTDELVGWAREAEGMDGRRVLCEKWW